VLLVTSRFDLRRVEAAAPFVLGVGVLLLALAVAAGHVSHGASRWLKLGFLTLQPTDAGRLAAVLVLAWWLKRRPPAELGFWRGFAPPLALVGALAGLILLQPNLSSAGLLGLTGFVMVYLSGARLRHMAVPVALGGLLVVFALKTHPYMMGRLATFIRFTTTGELDNRGAGWQLDQSLIAIGSGGWHGRGLGGGLQKYLFLPEAHTDFIFAIIGEEFGMLGAAVVVALFALLIWRGLRIGLRAPEAFGSYLALGLTVMLATQTLVNLGVVTGSLPTKGLPLPFISFGGSALTMTLFSTGVLLNISQHTGTS